MKIIVNGKTLTAENEVNLLDFLRKNKEHINAVCAGKGTCGKCLVKIKNPSPPREEEKAFVDENAQAEGMRLACFTKLFDGLELETAREKSISTAGTIKTEKVSDTEAVIAVADIGTTTVALGLVDEKNGVLIDCITENNAQAPYGADVITRIKSAASDKSEQHRLIITQTENMLSKLMKKNGISKVNSLYIAGNTTMMHLFFGYDCTPLGFFPYTPVFLESKEETAQKLGMKSFGTELKIISLPCISSFVGADISAGVLCNLSEDEAYTLLIDLGTNAEIVLFNKDKYFASSAAAGPAFEGATIKNGTAAIPGALCSFCLEEGRKVIKTVGDEALFGICGSGLIDLTAALLAEGIIDEMGQLSVERYEIDANTALYPEDIREVQLAKSAVCSVVEMLVKTAGIEYGEIGKIYLSGGFGSYINIENARKIGLIPKEISALPSILGNSSLSGTIIYALNIDKRAIINETAKNITVLDFTKDNDFSDRFIENIIFEI